MDKENEYKNLIFQLKNYRNEKVIRVLIDYITFSMYLENFESRECFISYGWNVAKCVSHSFHDAKNTYNKADRQLVPWDLEIWIILRKKKHAWSLRLYPIISL